jgi:protoporphyrinogen oxidase
VDLAATDVGVRRHRRRVLEPVQLGLAHQPRLDWPERDAEQWTEPAVVLLAEDVERRGVRVVFNAPVEQICWQSGRVTGVRAGGNLYTGDHFISSIPIRELILRLKPAPAEKLRRAMDDFHYRDFITVALIIRGSRLFPDNWIYVHDPAVAVGRIQNYANWSPEMTPDAATTCLGFEYFCQQGDSLWTMTDEKLRAQAMRELAYLGLADPNAVIDAKVVRVPKAYPVYDGVYQRGIAATRHFLETVPNLQLVGRNGMHRYNNQDHSMLTAILAARNVMGARYDLWDLKIDSGYLEEGSRLDATDIQALEDTQPGVPGLVASAGA